MCGLVAIADWKGGISDEALARACAVQRHRGPDEEGRWIAPARDVGLGHVRLSIIDPSNGRQPILSEDEQTCITATGEFYNFKELRTRLIQRGHRFRTGSDSEIALHLFEDHGAECLEHLRGEFAFVIWDRVKRTLFAARDRFGIKPLFYAPLGGGVVLTSEAKALFAAGVSPSWDDESVLQSVVLCPAPDRSLFRDVRQVPPGHYLLATPRSTQLVPYWDVDILRTHELPEDEAVPLTRALLRDAIALRTEADVPVGCYLSGGLDSSAVLGFATEATRKPVTAFTVAFDHPAYDEAPKAAEAARHVGASFNPISVNGEDFAEHFSDAVWHSEMIHFNAHGVARYLLSRAVQQSGHKVVLAGEGADELFAGYAFSAIPVISKSNRAFRMALALLAMASRPRRRSARILSSLATTAVRCLGMFGRRRRTPEMLTARARVLHRLLSPDFVREFGNWDPGPVLLGPLVERDEWQRADPVKLALYLWIKFVLANYHLAAERLDMAHGVEIRLPFLDHPLFEAVQAFPLALLRKNGQRKYLLREASRSVVTDSVYRGRKQPFLAPPPSLRNDGLHTMIQDVLRSSQMKAVRFFDGSAVRRLLESLPKMTPQARTAYDPFLLMMVSISILQERYGL